MSVDQILQIRQEEQAKFEMQLSEQIKLNELQMNDIISNMNTNFNLQREKDIAEL